MCTGILKIGRCVRVCTPKHCENSSLPLNGLCDLPQVNLSVLQFFIYKVDVLIARIFQTWYGCTHACACACACVCVHV